MNYTFRQITSRPDREGRCRIVLDVTWDGGRAKLPTGVSCLPAHFAPDARRIVSAKDANSARLNNDLSKAEAAVSAVFTLASAESRVPAGDELLSAARGALGRKSAPRVALPASQGPADLSGASFLELHAYWLRENPHQPYNSQRRYNQVLKKLEEFSPGMGPAAFTRQTFSDYLQFLAEVPVADSTVLNHVKWLRETHRLTGRIVPPWLKNKTKYGRSPSLRRDELLRLLTAPLPPNSEELAIERDLFLFQLFALLRDSDLRELRPHHVTQASWPGHAGPVYLLDFYQSKTADAVRLPLPAPAVAIWKKFGGVLPVDTQQERNRRLKDLGCALDLDRPFVQVKFYRGKPREVVGPLYQFLKTHTARHSGADMVLWGSEGDQNLKELALGHAEGASVYGYDVIERYGPALLKSWEKVLGATGQIAPNKGDSTQTMATHCARPNLLIQRVSYATPQHFSES